MKSNHVQYQVSGPPGFAASAKLVPDSAAWEIRTNAFLYGTLFGLVLALVAIVALAMSHSSTQPDNGTTVSDVPGGPRKEAASPGSVPGTGPSTIDYVYSISEDAFLPVTRLHGAPQATGTIREGAFQITTHRPSGTALTLLEDINDAWTSPMVFSASTKKAMPLQRTDGSWWSESRGAYMPWDTKNDSPDQYIYDEVHEIAVPLVKLSRDEYPIVAGRPLKRFHDYLCIFSASKKAFVPLHCPINPRALWNEDQSEYVAPSGEVFTAETLYPAASDNQQNQETKE